MNIFELASQLGKALKEDEKLVRLADAKKAYETDKDLQKMMVEYEVQQKAIQKVAAEEDFDAQLLESIQNRINELYEQIMAAPVYVELLEAQDASQPMRRL